MRNFITAGAVALAVLAGPSFAKGPKTSDPLRVFPGQGKGFDGFKSGQKPGNGIPGGTISTNRSPVAVERLLHLFGSVSTVGTTGTQ